MLADDRVSVSLSHYCPTAAASLFEPTFALSVDHAPKAFPADWPFEGLDVRERYSPLLRPGVLLGPTALRELEIVALEVLSNAPDAWVAMERLDDAVESVRAWVPEAGPLRDWMGRAFSGVSGTNPPARSLADPRPVIEKALQGEPPGSASLPTGDFVTERPRLSPVVDLALRRYLAARLFAAWVVHQSSDVRVIPAYLRLCLSTVVLFAAARPDLADEVERYKEAIRHADLWILHYCDPESLADTLAVGFEL